MADDDLEELIIQTRHASVITTCAGDKMPSQPNESVLYREFSRLQAKGILVNVIPLLVELINNGTHVLIRCADSPTTTEDDIDLAPLAIYRHILEITDAFHILVSESSSTPTIPLLRSTFEALLSLEFILETETIYKSRSLQWLTSHIKNQLRINDSLLLGSDRQKEFASKLMKDKTVNSFPTFPQVPLKKNIANLQSLLNKDHFGIIEAEFQRLKDLGISNPNWYSLFDGPKSIEELANYLKRNAQYEVLYRHWSRVSHAQSFEKFFYPSKQGHANIRGLRDPGSLIEFSRFSLVFIIDATRQMLAQFRPGEDFSAYYTKEIYPRFKTLLPKA